MNQQDDDMLQQHLAETAVSNERQLKGKCVIGSGWNGQLIMIKISMKYVISTVLGIRGL